MKRLLIIICAVAFMLSCAKRITMTDIERDSVSVEVRERVEYVTDTVTVVIPHIFAERETRDTSSYLENEYAMSHAYTSGGILFHSLATKPQLRGFEFQAPVIYRDSVVYRNFYRDITTEVVRELSWWQRLQINGFWALLILLLIISTLRWVGRE